MLGCLDWDCCLSCAFRICQEEVKCAKMSSLRDVYDGREPPKQKKRRKKRRHGKPTEVEMQAAASGGGGAAAAESLTKSNADQAMPASKKSKRRNSKKSQAKEGPPAQIVNALVPEKMSGGEIMAVAVGNRQLLVKVPMNCQSLDGLRIEVPPVLSVDLPAVREEDADEDHIHSDEVSAATTAATPAAGSLPNQPSCLLFAAPVDTSKSDSKPVEGNAAPCFNGVGIAGAIKLARQQALREYTVRLSAVSKHDGPDFAQTLEIATAQARVVGGKYRYGSVLVSGADFCPAVSGGSNYAKYGRKKIHAELASLKGLSPQVVARHATAPPRCENVFLFRTHVFLVVPGSRRRLHSVTCLDFC